jgi:hypothetical protein
MNKQYIQFEELKRYILKEAEGDKIYWNGGVFWSLIFSKVNKRSPFDDFDDLFDSNQNVIEKRKRTKEKPSNNDFEARMAEVERLVHDLQNKNAERNKKEQEEKGKKKGVFRYYYAVRKDDKKTLETSKTELGKSGLLKTVLEKLKAGVMVEDADINKEPEQIKEFYQYKDLYDLYYMSVPFVLNTEGLEDEEVEKKMREIISGIEEIISNFMKSKKKYVQVQMKSSSTKAASSFAEATRWIRQMVENPSQFNGYNEFLGAVAQMYHMSITDFLKRYGTHGDLFSALIGKGAMELTKAIKNWNKNRKERSASGTTSPSGTTTPSGTTSPSGTTT